MHVRETKIVHACILGIPIVSLTQYTSYYNQTDLIVIPFHVKSFGALALFSRTNSIFNLTPLLKLLTS
jgi:hypothetical protein